VSISSNKGWEKSVVVTNEKKEEKATILIDYNHLSIRCKFYFDTLHCMKDCPNRLDLKKPKNGSIG
jgi:hypothetical protein